MLICDHWYMVNCAKAENDYGANLLIGKLAFCCFVISIDRKLINYQCEQLRLPLY